MQKHGIQSQNFSFRKPDSAPESPFMKEVFGVINPYSPRVSLDSDVAISQKQIEILEDAIRRYERLEDIRKFSAIALEDIENVTEEDIQRAVELENTVSIEDERAVLNLIQNEGFLKDLESADFSNILSSIQNSSESSFSNEDDAGEDFFDDFDV